MEGNLAKKKQQITQRENLNLDLITVHKKRL
jgi:hypothetical protein